MSSNGNSSNSESLNFTLKEQSGLTVEDAEKTNRRVESENRPERAVQGRDQALEQASAPPKTSDLDSDSKIAACEGNSVPKFAPLPPEGQGRADLDDAVTTLNQNIVIADIEAMLEADPTLEEDTPVVITLEPSDAQIGKRARDTDDIGNSSSPISKRRMSNKSEDNSGALLAVKPSSLTPNATSAIQGGATVKEAEPISASQPSNIDLGPDDTATTSLPSHRRAEGAVKRPVPVNTNKLVANMMWNRDAEIKSNDTVVGKDDDLYDVSDDERTQVKARASAQRPPTAQASTTKPPSTKPPVRKAPLTRATGRSSTRNLALPDVSSSPGGSRPSRPAAVAVTGFVSKLAGLMQEDTSEDKVSINKVLEKTLDVSGVTVQQGPQNWGGFDMNRRGFSQSTKPVYRHGHSPFKKEERSETRSDASAKNPGVNVPVDTMAGKETRLPFSSSNLDIPKPLALPKPSVPPTSSSLNVPAIAPEPKKSESTVSPTSLGFGKPISTAEPRKPEPKKPELSMPEPRKFELKLPQTSLSNNLPTNFAPDFGITKPSLPQTSFSFNMPVSALDPSIAEPSVPQTSLNLQVLTASDIELSIPEPSIPQTSNFQESVSAPDSHMAEPSIFRPDFNFDDPIFTTEPMIPEPSFSPLTFECPELNISPTSLNLDFPGSEQNLLERTISPLSFDFGELSISSIDVDFGAFIQDFERDFDFSVSVPGPEPSVAAGEIADPMHRNQSDISGTEDWLDPNLRADAFLSRMELTTGGDALMDEPPGVEHVPGSLASLRQPAPFPLVHDVSLSGFEAASNEAQSSIPLETSSSTAPDQMTTEQLLQQLRQRDNALGELRLQAHIDLHQARQEAGRQLQHQRHEARLSNVRVRQQVRDQVRQEIRKEIYDEVHSEVSAAFDANLAQAKQEVCTGLQTEHGVEIKKLHTENDARYNEALSQARAELGTKYDAHLAKLLQEELQRLQAAFDAQLAAQTKRAYDRLNAAHKKQLAAQAQEACQPLREEMKQLKASHDSTATRYAEYLADLETERLAMTAEKKILEAEKMALEAERKSFETDKVALQAEISGLGPEHSAQEAEIEGLRSTIEGFEAQTKNLKDELGFEQKRCRDSEERNQRLKHEANMACDELKAGRNELKAGRDTARDLRYSEHLLQQEARKLKDDLSSERKRCKALEARVKILEREVSGTVPRAMRGLLKKQCEELKKERNELANERNEWKRSTLDMEQKLQALRETNEALGQQSQDLSQDLSASEERVTDLEGEITGVRNRRALSQQEWPTGIANFRQRADLRRAVLQIRSSRSEIDRGNDGTSNAAASNNNVAPPSSPSLVPTVDAAPSVPDISEMATLPSTESTPSNYSLRPISWVSYTSMGVAVGLGLLGLMGFTTLGVPGGSFLETLVEAVLP